jgi:hypothetical protein
LRWLLDMRLLSSCSDETHHEEKRVEADMNFAGLFQQRLDPSSRRSTSRFADLKRRPGFFAVADHFAANGPREVTV